MLLVQHAVVDKPFDAAGVRPSSQRSSAHSSCVSLSCALPPLTHLCNNSMDIWFVASLSQLVTPSVPFQVISSTRQSLSQLQLETNWASSQILQLPRAWQHRWLSSERWFMVKSCWTNCRRFQFYVFLSYWSASSHYCLVNLRLVTRLVVVPQLSSYWWTTKPSELIGSMVMKTQFSRLDRLSEMSRIFWDTRNF